MATVAPINEAVRGTAIPKPQPARSGIAPGALAAIDAAPTQEPDGSVQSNTTPQPAAVTTSTPPPVTPSAQDVSNTANQQSAQQQINSFLASVPGLSTLDPSGLLGSWMNGQVGTLAGQGIDSSTIVNTIEDTVNNPSNDPAAKAVFDQIFPGYNEKIANGTTNTNGSYTGIAGYLQYANQIQAYAQTATLPPGTVTPQVIGEMWAGNISAGEVSDRITSAYVAATNTPQNVQDYLGSTYNMGPGDIAGYYLNPANSLANLNAVNAGIAGVETGFGSLSQSQAASLSAFLQPSSSSGVTPIAVSDITGKLTSGLGGGIDGSAAQLAALETAGPGQNSGSTVTQNELLSAIGVPGEGTTQNQALIGISNAQQTRTAGARGGGGAATTSNGAAGLGFAES